MRDGRNIVPFCANAMGTILYQANNPEAVANREAFKNGKAILAQHDLMSCPQCKFAAKANYIRVSPRIAFKRVPTRVKKRRREYRQAYKQEYPFSVLFAECPRCGTRFCSFYYEESERELVKKKISIPGENGLFTVYPTLSSTVWMTSVTVSAFEEDGKICIYRSGSDYKLVEDRHAFGIPVATKLWANAKTHRAFYFEENGSKKEFVNVSYGANYQAVNLPTAAEDAAYKVFADSLMARLGITATWPEGTIWANAAKVALICNRLPNLAVLYDEYSGRQDFTEVAKGVLCGARPSTALVHPVPWGLKQFTRLRSRFYSHTPSTLMPTGAFLQQMASVNGIPDVKSFRRMYAEDPKSALFVTLLTACGFKDLNIVRNIMQVICESGYNYEDVLNPVHINGFIRHRGEKLTAEMFFPDKRSFAESEFYNERGFFYDMLRSLDQILATENGKAAIEQFYDLPAMECHDAAYMYLYKLEHENVELMYPKEILELNDKVNGYLFKPASCTDELVEIGTKLHNCVGTYRDRAIKGLSRLITINGKSGYEACLELDAAGTLVQARAACNRPITGELNDALQDWLKKHEILDKTDSAALRDYRLMQNIAQHGYWPDDELPF